MVKKKKMLMYFKLPYFIGYHKQVPIYYNYDQTNACNRNFTVVNHNNYSLRGTDF